MDGGADDEWEDASFLDEIFRATDEAVASRNPNPTPTPISYITTAAPISYLPAPSASTSVSYLPAASASVSYLPAASYPSPALRFSPPRELTQRPPLPPPPAASSDGEAMAMVGRGFSPPRELSQRSTAEESDLAIVAEPGPVGGRVAAKRERESRELEKLKRELSRASKQINELKNECSELRKDRTKKDLQIKAKEVEIQNMKKANVFASKDVCSTGMDIDQSFHATANGALHAGGSSWASTRRTDKTDGKDNDANSLQVDLYMKQGHQTDLPEAMELKRHTMIDNGISTSGGLSLEDNTHFEPRSTMCKEIKAIGVQTDSTSDSGHLECKKISVERISSNLRAIWGVPTNSLSRRNLISKIIVSCSEEILSLLQCTRLTASCEASSSMNKAISQVYDMFIKMNNEKIPMQTFLEAVLNLCVFDNAAIVSRTLRILLSILQHLLNMEPSLVKGPVMLKLLCSGGKDGTEQMESEGCENDRLKLLCIGGKDGSEQMESEGCQNDGSQVISSVLVDLSECLSCGTTGSLEIELCQLVIVLLAYIASSGKLGYEVLLGPVSAHGANFVELIMQVLASQMQYETPATERKVSPDERGSYPSEPAGITCKLFKTNFGSADAQ